MGLSLIWSFSSLCRMMYENGVCTSFLTSLSLAKPCKIDPDKYLPTETYNWTRTQLLELGFDPESPPETAGVCTDYLFILFYTTYLELRSRIKTHIQQGSQPILELSRAPTGTFNWDLQCIPDKIEEVEYNGELDENS
jgi:hypothetical protein